MDWRQFPPWEQTMLEVVCLCMFFQGLIVGACLQYMIGDMWKDWLGQFVRWVWGKTRDNFAGIWQRR